MTAIAVTIAGSDSGGGAGIQADLKTFSAFRVYGASVLTALTAQNTRRVSAVHDVPADFVRAQIDAVYGDLAVKATKIGMLSQPAIIESVAAGLATHQTGPVVLDPVMVAASGDPLITDDAVDVLRSVLIPRVDLGKSLPRSQHRNPRIFRQILHGQAQIGWVGCAPRPSPPNR